MLDITLAKPGSQYTHLCYCREIGLKPLHVQATSHIDVACEGRQCICEVTTVLAPPGLAYHPTEAKLHCTFCTGTADLPGWWGPGGSRPVVNHAATKVSAATTPDGCEDLGGEE